MIFDITSGSVFLPPKLCNKEQLSMERLKVMEKISEGADLTYHQLNRK